MKKRVLLDIIVLIAISTFFAYFLCIYYLDNFLLSSNASPAVLLSLKAFCSVLIFIFLYWLNSKKGLIFILKISLSVFVSYRVCYYLLDDHLVLYNDSQLAFLTLRIFSSVFIYIILIWLTDKKIPIIVKDIFFATYLIFILVLSLCGSRYSSIFTAANFNLFNIFKGARLIIFLNAVEYIPLGFYIKSRVKFKSIYTFLGFLLYISLFEFFQLVFKLGYFDINDIILNTFGFSLGIILFNILFLIKNKTAKAEFVK